MACLFVLLCFILAVSAVGWLVWAIMPLRVRRWLLYRLIGDGTFDPEIEEMVHKR